MKRKCVIASGFVILAMITSGLAASVAWFVAGENTFRANVDGSVVEEYFHCGSGTVDDPFVITRPMHYYHLAEFFQRKTELHLKGGGTVTFGTDYLYFQIGYNLDKSQDGSIEVYNYNNDGSAVGDISYSHTLNMAYFSGDNALMPIGTSECPFFGTFDGGGDKDHPATSITVENVNIKSVETVVDQNHNIVERCTSDVGMFGYVADEDSSGHATSIQNLYVNNLTIDLTGAAADKEEIDNSVPHTLEHDETGSDGADVHVGYIVGHLHTYTSYVSQAEQSSPLCNVYVNNAKIEGGYDGAKCSFGYVGYADTIDGVPGTEYDLATQIAQLEAESGGGGSGQDDEWGGSFNSQEYTDWAFNLFGYTTGTAASPNEKTVAGEYKLSVTNSEVMNPSGFIMLFNNTSNYYLFYTNGTGNCKINGSSYSFTWTYDANAVYHPYLSGFKIVLPQSVSFSGGTTSTVYLHADGSSSTSFRQYSSSSGSGKNALANITFTLRNSIYRLRNNSYIPLRFEDDTKEATHKKNTGYIVGTNVSTAANASPKIASYGINHINQSISDTNQSYDDIVKGKGEYDYNDANLEVLTYSGGNWVCIKDSHNSSHTKSNSALSSYSKSDSTTPSALGYIKYDASRTTIGNLFANNRRLHGIHFDTEFSGTTPLNVIGDYNASDTRNTTKGLAVSSGIKISGTEYDKTYYLPKGSIDFNLKKTGIINFFAGTYSTTSSVTFNFFSLYQVFRTLSNNQYIYTVKELDAVYRNKYWNSAIESDATTNPKYFYKYKDGSFSSVVVEGNTRAATLADRDTTAGSDGLEFDASILRATAPVKNALYYFEIPVNNGEFAMGYVSTTTANSLQGAYLIYLDIGANGDVIAQDYDTENKIGRSPIFTQMEYLSEGYIINSCFNIGFVVPDGSTKNNFWVIVSREGDIFNVTIVNTTEHDVTLYVLLIDNNNDPEDTYPYKYTLTYNNGTKSQEYGSSEVWEGTSGGTVLTKQTS